jgi:hypothetical protein
VAQAQWSRVVTVVVFVVETSSDISGSALKI